MAKIYIEFGTTSKAADFSERKIKGVKILKVVRCEVQAELGKGAAYNKLLERARFYGGTIYMAD